MPLTPIQDLRQALRALRRSPGFTLGAVMMLALGVGANTAIFSLINGVLLRPLPYHEPGGLVWIWSVRSDRDRAFFSIPNFIDSRDQNVTLKEMSAFASLGANLTGSGDPERLQGVRVTPNAFGMLGAKAAEGRLIQPGDLAAGGTRVVVLSHALWRRRFGSEKSLIGRTLTLNGDAYTVLGILPAGFVLPGTEVDLAVPLDLATDSRRTERGSNFLRAFARLKPGVTPRQAEGDLAAISDRLRDGYPEDNAKLKPPRVVPLDREITGVYGPVLVMLAAAVGAVLLILCANVAGLVLARGSSRRREFAIRAALGAQRLRLFTLSFTESALLALAGGILGLLIAWWGGDLLLALSPAELPRAATVSLDGRVFAFSLGISALAAVIFGLAPSLQAAGAAPLDGLKGAAGEYGGGARQSRFRSWLVSLQAAASLVLLVCAGLFIQSFQRVHGIRPGIETRRLLTARLSLPRSRYRDGEALQGFFEKTLSRILSLPGVTGAGVVSVLPLSGQNTRADFTVAGRKYASASDVPGAQNRWVTPGYFRIMGIPLLRGREFSSHDDLQGAPVAVIDRTLADRFWPGGDPIGSRLSLDDGGRSPREVEVVGVVGEVKHGSLEDPAVETIYAPIFQAHPGAAESLANVTNLVVRTRSDAAGLESAVRRAVQAVDPDVPAAAVRTMEQILSTTVGPRRFSASLLEIFSAAALLLAAIGLYATASHSVARRTREIGIRIALGASSGSVLLLVARHSALLILAGVALGLAASFALTRTLAGLLYQVNPLDPAVLTAATLVLAGAALLASYVPARRATRIDPLAALRYE